MTTVSTPDDPATARRALRLKYVSHIQQSCRNDPGTRSALRSGVRRGLDSVPRMHRIVAPWLPRPNGRALPDDEQRAYYTIAAMIAEQSRHRLASEPGPDTDPEREAPSATETGPAASDQDSARPLSARYGTSLGAAFAEALTAGPGREREMRASTAEQRLNLLTRQSVNGLHRHLPASVRYLLSLEVPVDFAQLLDDLIAWPTHSARISRRWLQDYYRLSAKAARDNAAQSDEQAPLDANPSD
jgi:CRISPR system Cascade subunit CasB